MLGSVERPEEVGTQMEAVEHLLRKCQPHRSRGHDRSGEIEIDRVDQIAAPELASLISDHLIGNLNHPEVKP